LLRILFARKDNLEMKRIYSFSVWFTLFVTLALLQVPVRLSAQSDASGNGLNVRTSPPTAKQILSKTFTLDGGKVWTDAGISLEPGQRVTFTAKGSLRYADAKADNGPEGLTRGFKDLIRILPFNDAGRGAVIGRIGDPDIAQPFLIGESKDVEAPVSGKLSIGINQAGSDTGDGSYTVKVTVYAADTSVAREVARQVPSMPGIDDSLFSKIPRRIGDKEGNPGDMVNFLILGTEDQMKKVFTAAGWVAVDADVKSTVLAGALASLSKESYLTMPMSPLYLFGRTQDYGWAHAEPITVVASRNHLRIWKAPFTVNGQTLWVGAATHDIGFEKDQRNNGLTHKIDPNIDAEREFVEKTLSSTGLVAQVTHYLPQNPLQQAKTATGGGFHSNGQVLVLKLADSTSGSTTAAK
jgi:LssY C-terminus